jgi:predicted PurR-regulated permease PerM
MRNIDEIIQKLEQSLEGDQRNKELLNQIKQILEEINKREREKKIIDDANTIFAGLLFLIFLIALIVGSCMHMMGSY